jgi:hypothetical protein
VSWYGDGICDCGCGAQDFDCSGTSDVSECTYCIDCPGTGACAERVDARDTTQCSAAAVIPADWVCPDSYFGDGGCDCGCGARDRDCASSSDVGECAFCEACGVFAGDDCASAVDPVDTTFCR